MKRLILLTLAGTFFISTQALAQKVEKADKKTKEIIIRRDGDQKTKMKIEIDGDKVTIDGKPLSEYENDDVRVIERERVQRGSGNFLLRPGTDEWRAEIQELRGLGSSAFLGVITEKAENGAKINEVVKESSAEKSGLKENDIISKINEKPVNNPEDLMEAVRSYKPGDEITLHYTRDGKKKNMKIKLGENKRMTRVYGLNKAQPYRFNENFQFNMPDVNPLNQNHMRFYRNNNVKLGVKVEDAADNKGAKVIEVNEGSPAAAAGLKKDDIITEANNEKINDVDDLRSELMHGNDADVFKIKALRNNTTMNFEVKIPRPKNTTDL
jgi:serine protease Do